MTVIGKTAQYDHTDIAIIGMAGRFPGAASLEAYWHNLKDGIESRSVFSDEELKAAGYPAAVLSHPKFVKSGFVLDDIEHFDAAFFGINPREAEVLDPQHRLFLETAWQALECAGYDSDRFPGPIAVFGGATYPSYVNKNVMRNAKIVKAMGERACVHGSVSDYMVTRVSYKLNLKGPCYFVQTACSTSLVAVHMGCQSLTMHESDMVLAGGVSIQVPHRVGYIYEEGGMLSPDGVCRTFDASSRGTVFGNGVGVVVLKRLHDALADGDTIHAVIKGTASNNDGSLKVGFTAPSVAGQARVVADAMANAGVTPDSIQYVEAHGTGTEIGDPIEVAALTRAYRSGTDRSGFCAIGSVKPNIGHLDAAAGVSSLIKTVLALQHRQIPPTINFVQPNEKIDFENSPFYVNTELQAWPSDGSPRRAGVSSFGFGGTNAHIIVEEAPVSEPADPARSVHVLTLSARSEAALESTASRLADTLTGRANVSLADVAYTLQVGRRPFAHRRAIVCGTVEDAVEALQGRDPRRTFTGRSAANDRRVAFLFPGQGAQYVNMGLDLYTEEPLYREIVDDCAAQLQEHLGVDLREVLYPAGGPTDEAAERLKRTSVTQAALFVTEYALARLWMQWGVAPSACLGHSIGELVAACLADVMSLSDALRLVALRGRLMEQMPDGVMAAVPLPEERVRPLLEDGVWLAAINSPGVCIVSGVRDRVEQLVQRLAAEGVEGRPLHTSHAFHSGLMDAAIEPFVRECEQITLSAPRLPILSNVTGDWLTEAQATSPAYWGQHIRQAVRFADGVSRLLAEPEQLLLEVGPGNTLGGLVRQCAKGQGGHVVLASLPHVQDQTSDVATMAAAVGRLWMSGAAIDWDGLHAGLRRRRIPLPTYPFERQRFWVEPDKFTKARLRRLLAGAVQENFSEWFHVPSWKRTPLPAPLATAGEGGSDQTPLLFVDACGVGEAVALRLAEAGYRPTIVEAGSRFGRIDEGRYAIDISSRADYVELLQELRATDRMPETVAHFWGVTRDGDAVPDAAFLRQRQEHGFYSLLSLAQAFGEVAPTAKVRISVLTDGVHEVTGAEPLVPEKATVLGPCRVIPQEFPNAWCRNVDLPIDPSDPSRRDVEAIAAELFAPVAEAIVAYRRGRRWVQTWESTRLDEVPDGGPSRLRVGGTYLITGGTGGIGLVLARYLAQAFRARLVLTSRRGLPPRERWADYAGRPNDDTAAKIRLVQELEAVGAEVIVGAADVTDEVAMAQVVDEACERFGRIDGVIHAAGIAGGGMIQLKKPEVAASVLAPKVVGTRVLARIFENRPPDFLVLCSSLAGVLGGVGQVDYCGANAYLDAFARQHAATTKTFTVSVNWNAWREVGMAVDTSVPDDLRDTLKGAALATGISNAQGVDAFRRVLNQHSERQIALSPHDIELALEENRAAKTTEREETMALGDDQSSSSESRHPRPSSLQTPMLAPRTEVEKKICAVWQDSLGIDRIGIDDNFFELGGHSLMAVGVMARVNALLHTDVPVAKLYEGLTVRFLASLIDAPAPQPGETPADESDELSDRRKDKARRQREHQMRRRVVMRR